MGWPLAGSALALRMPLGARLEESGKPVGQGLAGGWSDGSGEDKGDGNSAGGGGWLECCPLRVSSLARRRSLVHANAARAVVLPLTSSTAVAGMVRRSAELGSGRLDVVEASSPFTQRTALGEDERFPGGHKEDAFGPRDDREECSIPVENKDGWSLSCTSSRLFPENVFRRRPRATDHSGP